MPAKPFSFVRLFSIFFFLPCVPGFAASAAKPNIFLISADTLGARHMSLHGYVRRTTPHIDAFAKDAIVFENNFSQAPYTLASHFSIFTGTFPHTHGMLSVTKNSRRALDPSRKMLAEYLRESGYRTRWIGPLRDPQLPLGLGLERGFEKKFNIRLHSYMEYPDQQAYLEKILEEAKQAPTFFFFHSYSVHDPYRPSPPHHRVFSGDFKRKRFETLDEIENQIDSDRTRYMAQFNLKDKRDVAHLEALYDEAVLSFDAKFQHFLELLKAKGLYENSIILLTSDHGEAFGAHGHFHHQDPYSEELHVPLVLKVPGQEPRRISASSLSVDIAPTLLELLGISPSAALDGSSLVPLLKGESADPDRLAFAKGYRSEAVWDSRWKLLIDEKGERELYRVAEDKDERNNVAKEFPGEVLRLEAALERARLTAAANPRPFRPFAENKKLYWFIPDGMRADRDAFDIFRWAREGKLPNIRRMMQEGSYGYSIPDFPSHTPINFASLLTGAHPSVHGIADGPMHVEGAPLAKPSAPGFASTTKRVPAAWKTFEAAGKNVFLLSVPGSTPPEISGTTIRGRWGGWGADTFNLVFESKGMLPRRKELGRAFRLFFLGDALTRFVETSVLDKDNIVGNLEAHGLSIPLRTAAPKSGAGKIRFQAGGREIALAPGEWSDWIPVELEVKQIKFPSHVKIRVIKIWADGNFRVRVLYDNLNRLIAEPGSAAEVLTAGIGPMVDHMDNWPPQLIFEPEDRQVSLDEMRMSLEWHHRAVRRVIREFNPDIFIHDTYTPNQMLESRWWKPALHPVSGATKKETARAKAEVLEMYKKLDDILGHAIHESDASTVIALSSDHGVCPLKRLVHLNNLFAQRGWLKFTIDPTTGEPQIDWKNTKVVYLKMLHVYVNPDGLGGDWKRGSGPEYEKLRDEVVRAIASLKDKDGTRPLVRAVRWEEAKRVYDLPMDRVGDLVLEAKLNYFWFEEVGEKLPLFSDPLAAGYKQAIDPRANECMWTPFVLWGAGVKKNNRLAKPISHVDQLPTLLHIMDIPAPAHTQGRVLSEALD